MIEWHSDHKLPVLHCLALVLEELAELAMGGFRRYPWGGVEAGGVLFGLNEPDGVHIHAFRPFECEHEYGPAFELSAKEFESFGRLLASAASDEGLHGFSPVGWYHSVSRRELSLSDHDRALHARFCPEPWQVAMTLKRSRKDPLTVGFFCARADGSLSAHSPPREFAVEDFRLRAADLGTVEPAPGVSIPAEGEPEPPEMPATSESQPIIDGPEVLSLPPPPPDDPYHFLGLTQNPFSPAPDPQFFSATAQHREALAILLHGIRRNLEPMLVRVRIRFKLANLDKHHGRPPAFHRSAWLSFGPRGGRIRRSLSLRAQLSLLVGTLVLVAIGSLGPIAYNTSRSIIESGAVREVGIAANARKQELIRVLTDQRVRAAALLKTASLGCAPEEIRCLQRVLADFLGTEGASAVRLIYRGRPPIIVGEIGAPVVDAGVPAHGELARFDLDGQKRPYYVITVQAVTRDGETAITLWGDMQVVNQIFRDRYGLGRSGDTFLVDSHGFFLTPPRDSLPAGVRQPIGGKAVQSCLAGSDSEILDQDYRGVPVIYGFRYVAEIGGGCIMALIEQSEAFAPTNRLRWGHV